MQVGTKRKKSDSTKLSKGQCSSSNLQSANAHVRTQEHMKKKNLPHLCLED